MTLYLDFTFFIILPLLPRLFDRPRQLPGRENPQGDGGEPHGVGGGDALAEGLVGHAE